MIDRSTPSPHHMNTRRCESLKESQVAMWVPHAGADQALEMWLAKLLESCRVGFRIGLSLSSPHALARIANFGYPASWVKP